jgi:hypothetical protein
MKMQHWMYTAVVVLVVVALVFRVTQLRTAITGMP